MFSLITFVAALGAVDVLALRYGADSRSVFDERREGERFGALR